jgi:hypothetical protein
LPGIKENATAFGSWVTLRPAERPLCAKSGHSTTDKLFCLAYQSATKLISVETLSVSELTQLA